MKKSAHFHLLAGIIAVISVFTLTCSNSNPATGSDNGGTGCTKPAAPAGVRAEPVSTSSIRVTWAPINDAILYTVYRSRTLSGTYSAAGRVLDVAAFTDTALTQATEYYYKVTAQNSCGEGVMSAPVAATTMTCSNPATPTNVMAEALSAVSIKVSWDSIPAAAYYEIYLGTSANGDYGLIDSTTYRSYTHTRLQISSTHYYKIVAKNSCGESEKSNSASATTNACPKPAAPTNVTAEVKSSSSIEITWDAVNTAITYKIYRSTTSAGGYSPVGNTAGNSSTSWTDEGLELAKTYYYTVVAESECEESAQSIYSFATTANCESTPGMPTNITAEALSPTEIRVSWDAVIGARSYSIYIKQENTTVDYYRAVSMLSGTSYIISSRHPSTIYHFKVSAVNDCGESEMSTSYATATTLACDLPILPRPTGITATALSARSVNISWNPVDGAVYDIYRSTERGGTFWTVSGARELTGTSFIDTTLSSSTTYYYAVESINSCGESADRLGDVVSVTTLCETPIPLNVTATAQSSGSIEVSWDAVNGAVSYSVYRAARNPNGQYTLIGKISGTNSTYTDAGLESLISYYYKVTAKTATCDDSRQSAYAAGTTQ
jgi:fibronectin type 3 domain-containing protein